MLKRLICLVLTIGSMVFGSMALGFQSFAQTERPLADTHLHYSHDAWSVFPPEEAVGLLRAAGLKRAFISSSNDDGTQKLYKQAPDLVVPVLRPYRRRGELSSWLYEPEIIRLMKERLEKNSYAGIGEFHVYGSDVETEIFQQVIQLAKKYDLFLHAHSDADAVERIFEAWPEARVLWAHSGFDQPFDVAEMMRKHPNLWGDLAFRSEQASRGKVQAGWRALFTEFPDRIMVGTDTFTPERWPFVPEHAAWTREWLNDLPDDVAEQIAWKNAERLLAAGTRSLYGACNGGDVLMLESEEGSARVAVAKPLDGARVGATMALELVACEGDWSITGFDATMPAHGHGMNYKPTLTKTGRGMRADGVLLHMPGAWEIAVDLRKDDERLRAIGTLELTR